MKTMKQLNSETKKETALIVYKPKADLEISLVYKKGGKENGRYFWRGYYARFELIEDGEKVDEKFELIMIAKKYSKAMYNTILDSYHKDCNVQGYIKYFLETGKIG